MDNIRDMYRLGAEVIGEGTYGYVRIGTHKQTQERFAIKVVEKQDLEKPNLVHREISVLQGMDHPNIIKIHETYEDPRHIYMVLELCEGGEIFHKLMQDGHFSESYSKILFRQMLSSVEYLHQRRIAHRDLKPENFLFANKNDPYSLKLIDFGFAKPIEKPFKKMKGTCYFICPEAICGQYDERCDLWSLGVVLYMMLCGEPPFTGETNDLILEAVRLKPLHFQADAWQDVSEDAKDLVGQMLEKDLSNRISVQSALSHTWLVDNDN